MTTISKLLMEINKIKIPGLLSSEPLRKKTNTSLFKGGRRLLGWFTVNTICFQHQFQILGWTEWCWKKEEQGKLVGYSYVFYKKQQQGSVVQSSGIRKWCTLRLMTSHSRGPRQSFSEGVSGWNAWEPTIYILDLWLVLHGIALIL